MNRTISKRPRRNPYLNAGRRTTFLGRTLKRLGGVCGFLCIVAVLFVSPYLERAHHVHAIAHKNPDAWDAHIKALCGVHIGHQMLMEHLVEAPEPHKSQLLEALDEADCLPKEAAPSIP